MYLTLSPRLGARAWREACPQGVLTAIRTHVLVITRGLWGNDRFGKHFCRVFLEGKKYKKGNLVRVN
jgi:hypothetical protein